jgi:hypothetical protein
LAWTGLLRQVLPDEVAEADEMFQNAVKRIAASRQLDPPAVTSSFYHVEVVQDDIPGRVA